MDGTDGDALAKAEIDARLRVYEDFAQKRREHSELADTKLVETPPLLGIPQTRFIEGEYKLTADDAIRGTRFDDVVTSVEFSILGMLGKTAGKPVGDLLGGVTRREVPICAACGNRGNTAEAEVTMLLRLVEQSAALG